MINKELGGREMSHEPEALAPTEAEAAEEAYWDRIYGRWDSMQLPEVRDFMEGFPRPWWMVGGWAIDAFTGHPREHSDADMSILACDVPALRAHVAGHWHLWNHTKGGGIRPLTDKYPEISDPASQIWVREHGDAPWVLDLPLTPDHDGLWTNKFMPDHQAPLDDVTWIARDGVRYLCPEIVLFFKARLRRTKDERDFRMARPLLADDQRSWLHSAIATAWGETHPWLPELI
jgi:hypothetical protein